MTDTYRRIYLDVPFADLKAAKLLGAQWDQTAKAWFVPAGIDSAALLNCWPRLAGDPASHRPGAINADGQLIAAKELGRLGGIAGGHKGGKARAAVTSPERRREIALMGVQARANKKAARLARRHSEPSNSQALSRAGSELRAGRGPGVVPAAKRNTRRRVEDASSTSARTAKQRELHALREEARMREERWLQEAEAEEKRQIDERVARGEDPDFIFVVPPKRRW